MTVLKSMWLAAILFVLKAQAQENVQLLSKNEAREKTLANAAAARYRQDVAALSGPQKTEITEIFKSRYYAVSEQFSKHQVVTDASADAYLTGLTAQIIHANPQLATADLRVVFSRAWWPNACSMGEGTILFNIALFNRLHNESEAVFALCHELAHYYLDHSNRQIRQYIATVNSDTFQKKLKTIQRSDYRQNQQLEDLAKHFVFNSRRHSRTFEGAADSMAVEFMKNTGFDLHGALTCLSLLDSVDADKYPDQLNLATRFDFSQQPFKKRWLESDVLMFTSNDAADDKAVRDSLKTHPDCKARIRNLEALVAKYDRAGTKKFLVDEQAFRRLQQSFDYDILDNCFESDNISRCLYYTLEMLNTYPNSAYLHAMAGRCLNELYSRQKVHEVGKVTDLPGPANEKEYNQLLQMIQNLRLTEIANIAYYYLQQYSTTDIQDPRFAAAWKTSVQHFSE